MSCPHCGRQVPSLSANIVMSQGKGATSYEIPVLMLACPHCQTILGLLQPPQAER